jgi:hypothetical protein
VALANDASSPAKVVKAAAGNTAVTASFTAPANALLMAFWEQDTSGNSVPTIADSGGLTWTLVDRLCADTTAEANTPAPAGTAQSGQIKAWKATTASSAARTVTVTEVGAGGTGKEGMLDVEVFTDDGGAPTVGAVATKGGSASAPTHTLTTTANDSWVWAHGNDWSASGTGVAGSNQTVTDTNDTTNDAQHVWKQNATTPTSGTVVTMNLTTPASQTYNIGLVEIKANPAAGGPALPIIVMAPRRQ